MIRLSERLFREWEHREERLRASRQERDIELKRREVVSKRGRMMEGSCSARVGAEGPNKSRPKTAVACSRRLHQEATARTLRQTYRRKNFLQNEKRSIRAEAKACLENPLQQQQASFPATAAAFLT